jgi:hypothetical protein
MIKAEVAGSSPDKIIEILSCSNTSSNTVVLGSTQPFLGDKARPAHKADFTVSCELIIYKMLEPR